MATSPAALPGIGLGRAECTVLDLALRSSGSAQKPFVVHTGCTRRPDGQVSVGFSLMRGKRATMEDFYTAQAGS